MDNTFKKTKSPFPIFILILLILPFSSSCQNQPIPKFDQELAFRHLETQCNFGARVPGTEPHQQCRQYLVQTLRKYTNQVTTQSFQITVGSGGHPATCYNIIANFLPKKKQRILLCAHWDTRPWADQDPNPANRSKPVPGASDGASGVSVLLEIARLIHLSPPKYGVDIVFFDAEDLGTYGNNESWALGSKEFAQRLSRRDHPEFGILVDLVGDADQQLYMENNSYQYARKIVERVWNKAGDLGIVTFIPEVKHDVYDDHINLLQVGIQCINIIDFDYPYWHTIEDTPDKCSPQSLGNVGRVLVELLYH